MIQVKNKRFKPSGKNDDKQYKMPLKLDFNTRSSSNVSILTTKPSKKKISVQSKLSNNIPRAPQTKRNDHLVSTFCDTSENNKLQQNPCKLTSRNNIINYCGIYNTLDNTKSSGHPHQLSTDKENITKQFKNELNVGFKTGSNFYVNKGNKNFRSMTSLLNKPSIPRKYSINKSRYVCANSNHSSNYVSKFMNDESKTRKNIFQQVSNQSRIRETS